MKQDIVVLLALQDDDSAVGEILEQIASFEPELRALDRALKQVQGECDRSAAELDSAEKAEHALQTRLDEQRALHERSVGQLDAVRKAREATAAMTQAEITRRAVEELEREVQAAVARVVQARARVKELASELDSVVEAQNEERARIQTRIAELNTELAAAEQKRAESALAVPRALLQKYEKLRSRGRRQAFFQLEGVACGNCDMAVPIQRRNVMSSSQSIEACEACGVLLYVAAG